MIFIWAMYMVLRNLCRCIYIDIREKLSICIQKNSKLYGTLQWDPCWSGVLLNENPLKLQKWSNAAIWTILTADHLIFMCGVYLCWIKVAHIKHHLYALSDWSCAENMTEYFNMIIPMCVLEWNLSLERHVICASYRHKVLPHRLNQLEDAVTMQIIA